jgi:hypothetical protein
MKPKGSLPSSQQPATCPYPEPDESNPQLPTIFIKDTFEYFSKNLCLVFQLEKLLILCIHKTVDNGF